MTTPSAPRFGVRTKLLSAFVLIAMFTGLLGWYAVAAIENVNSGQRATYRDIFGGTDLLAAWIDRAWETRRELFAYVTAEGPVERAALRAEIAENDLRLEQLSERMDAVDSDRAEAANLDQLMASWHTYARWRDAALASAESAHDPSLVMADYRDVGESLDSAIDVDIDSFLYNKRLAGRALEVSAEDTYEQVRELAIVLSIAAVALALGVGLFMSRHIAGAARQVAVAAEGLARGELDQAIEVRSSDELGQMATSFRNMVTYQQAVASVANAIANGDLTQDVEPMGEGDVLGNAFCRMSNNLRLLVGELQESVEYSRALLDEKERYAETIRQQVVKLSRLLEENDTLHDRLRLAAVRTAALNEQGLRRVGADLHDGPCQALGFALLRMQVGQLSDSDTETVRTAIADALAELRSIAAGLRLPELRDLPLPKVVERAVRDHERRSGTLVKLELRDLAEAATLPVKVAVFRALQEALSNATRHARGAEVGVDAWVAGDWLWLTVTDRGPGFQVPAGERRLGLGLASMRERAELLGGQFEVASTPGQGTRVQLCWPLSLAHSDPDGDAPSCVELRTA